MDQTTRRAIEANLFPGARAAIDPWEEFPWHRGRDRSIQTDKLQSSQALAIDVFGSIKMAQSRDSVMASIASALGLPARGPWRVDLEWEDRDVNRLQERRRTQVDAVAEGSEALIFFECKFTEQDGGQCSQTRRLTKGPHKGRRQCSGDYTDQRNRVTATTDRCALTGKGIRYWEAIPRVFEISADRDHRPCPFKGPWFQWMRNLVLCHSIAVARGLQPAFVVAYADAPRLPIARKVSRGGFADLSAALRPGAVDFRTVSIQEIIAVARAASNAGPEDQQLWKPLSEWVARKVSVVATRTETLSLSGR